ncbi:ABC-2 type transport system ATP-binding protein [Oceanobacillus limi]|uniref:ABC-2 type transport system ATP-binding protein n=1 Tax=Oceanobacillus limi TaxID=930131 RepID=A0A1I0E2Z5_9BACI|nr:AAA family ATPase [Oceanobacillus limi]SET38556.1 ABC-2 type transport system ATP-binding protein [Oceanobacillus limi]
MKLENINFTYKKQIQSVLENVSLELAENKLNVIIGMNGAGKTTLLDVISGVHSIPEFNPPFDDEDIVYQLQGIYLPPALKGKDLLRLILKSDSIAPFKALKERFINGLEESEKGMLDRLWTKKFGDMSVGERRWLTIRAITVLDRKLYIFDEPTAGIDPSSKTFIIDALQRLVEKEDVYVIMSTHILHELAYIDCQINFLHNGKIVFTGDYESFLQANNTDNPDLAFQDFLRTVG